MGFEVDKMISIVKIGLRAIHSMCCVQYKYIGWVETMEMGKKSGKFWIVGK